MICALELPSFSIISPKVSRVVARAALTAALLCGAIQLARAEDPKSAAALPTIRIKAGADKPFKDSAGNEWTPDSAIKDGGFVGGGTAERDTDLAIANTKDPGLYRSERWGMESFSLKLPNGKYVVKLHFAETYTGISSAGQRVFNFKVQDKEFNDFDIFKKAGGANRAYVETVPVDITDGKLKITFTAKENNPEINALEIIPADKAGPSVASAGNTPGGKSSDLPTVRIRAGSTKPYTDSSGNTWLPDEVTKAGGFKGGDTVERPDDMPIDNTKDPALYRAEHYGMDSFTYTLPNGKYVVKLHFAETFHGISGPGQRVFSFKVQDKEFKDFDLWKQAGGHQRAYIETVPVDITDGQLKIAFSTSANNPEINGIEIIPAENRPVPSRGLPPPKSTSTALPTIRMRAGSTKPYTDSKGNKWLPDESTKDGGFEGGDMSDRPADMPIENTKDPDLYRFEHWGMDSFNYKLPNGKYVVKLHFAETYDGISGPGGRVFTFKVQDKEFKDFDVWKKAGAHQRAYVETVPVDITDGKLTITFTSIEDNPEINGIEILPADQAK